MSVKAINFDSVFVRLGAAAAVGLVVLIAAFAFIWAFASAASSNSEFKEVGDLLARLSPSDPQTHFAAATLHEQALEAGDFEIALREYETAVALAPHNYLLWLRLAAVRGRNGETAGAEAALLHAKALAPNYSRVQWAWGNFLLREGRDDEAYDELRKAVAGDPTLAPLAAATALQMSEGDARAVSSRFEDSDPIDIALAIQLVDQKRFDEGMEMWGRAAQTNDDRYREAARHIRNQLLSNKRFAQALSIKFTDPANQPEVGAITNAGFEQPIRTEGAGDFDWKVTRGTYPQVGVTDTQKTSGNYSLLVLLSGQDQRDFRGPTQLVVVRPGAAYELLVQYRSDAKSEAAFHWEIVSAANGIRLAISPPLQNSAQWTSSLTELTVPPDTDGIEIRFVRGQCTGAKCSASGNLWFDDLSLRAK